MSQRGLERNIHGWTVGALVTVAMLCPACSRDPQSIADLSSVFDMAAVAPDLRMPPADAAWPPTDAPSAPEDLSNPDCVEQPMSTFLSASIRFVAPRCRFTLAEAAAGITFSYELVVDDFVPAILAGPGDEGSCGRPDASGLILLRTVSGAGQSWCRCDVGRCMPYQPVFATIPVGRYPGSFTWHGRNWTGPSDFNNPEGAPFPPGTYEVMVSASGQVRSLGNLWPFTIQDALTITLVP